MSTQHVTLDVGNSACKLRRWSVGQGRRPELQGAAEFASDLELVERLDAHCRGLALETCAASCVAAREVEAALERWIALRFDGRGWAAPDAGLDVRCAEPRSVGQDRLYAARGAFELLGRSSIVVDLGSAVTVDALVVEPTARPIFAGGAIAPGPRLMAEALAAGTARLPLVELRVLPPALGRDTRSAIQAGICHGLRGAVRELCERIADEAGLVAPPVIVTGGAAAILGDATSWATFEVHFEPELVHLGLLAAAFDRARPNGAASGRYGWRR